MTIIQPTCLFVALGIQRAMRMRHIVVCVLPLYYNILPHYLINGTISKQKQKVTEHKMCFDFLYNFYLTHFSF